jgi:hypothetical protein
MGKILSYELPADQLVYEPVFSIRARSPRPDGQPKNVPFAYDGLPPLGNDDGQVQKALF